jgi:5-methylcytosine-specific restriction endonuclease McrA
MIVLQEKYKAFCLNTSIEDYKYTLRSWNFLNTPSVNHREIKIELKKLSYDDFLLTWYWRTISNFLRKRDKKCKLCDSTENLLVHHKTYSHHGDELHHLNDLVVLCDKCHKKIHDKRKKRNTPIYQKKKVKESQKKCTLKQQKLKHKDFKSFGGESFRQFIKKRGHENETLTYQQLQIIYKAKQNKKNSQGA